MNNPGVCEFLGGRKLLSNEMFNILLEEAHIENMFENRIEK